MKKVNKKPRSFRSLYITISDDEVEQAIEYLAKQLPEGVLKEIMESTQVNVDWAISYHFGFGVDVRNLLRQGGFDWDDTVLDENWGYLVEEAAKRSLGKK